MEDNLDFSSSKRRTGLLWNISAGLNKLMPGINLSVKPFK